MNVKSLFYFYKIILIVFFIEDMCFSTRLIHICVRYFKWIAVNKTISLLLLGMYLPNMAAHFGNSE